MRIIFLISAVFFCGCTPPVSPVVSDSAALSELKTRLSGVKDSLTSQTGLLTENTAILREIRDAVKAKSPLGDSETPPTVADSSVDPDQSSPTDQGGVEVLSADEFEDGERREWTIEVDDCCKEPVAEKRAFADWYVVEFGATWCGPCKTWKANEQPKLEAAGVTVRTVDAEKNKAEARQFKVKKYPTILLCRRSTGKVAARWVGAVSADTILSRISQPVQAPAKPQPGKFDLITWIRSRYKPGQWLEFDVAPRSMVWSHLVEHGERWEDVRNLPQWEALCLHDACHRGLR